MLALVQVPEHGETVFATGSAQGTVGGDGDGVEVSSVANVVGLQATVGQVPDLTRPRSKSASTTTGGSVMRQHSKCTKT